MSSDQNASTDPNQIPYDAYKPFGNGQRATIVLGRVLKHFELIDHIHYQLKIKQTMTLKPDGFTLQVRPREGIDFAF